MSNYPQTLSNMNMSPFLLADAENGFKTPVEITPDELKKLTVTIMGFDFISFGSALICPVCGLQAGILINRAPDETFKFYLRFPCKDYDPEEKDAPIKVEIVTPQVGTVAE